MENHRYQAGRGDCELFLRVFWMFVSSSRSVGSVTNFNLLAHSLVVGRVVYSL